jgi:hypothetical protein
MAHHVRPPQYDWGYDWPDDCPPLFYGPVRFTNPPPVHPRAAIELPPCTPRAGVNTDWSGNKCAPLHDDASYALLPAPPAHPQVWHPAPSAQPQASQPAPPAQVQAPSADLPPCTPRAGINTDWSGNKCAPLHDSASDTLAPAPPAQPQASQPAPSAPPQAPAPPAQPQAPQPAPPAQSPAPAPSAQAQASQSAHPAQSPAPAPSAQPQASQPAPPAPSKPSAEPVTTGQAAHGHVHQQSMMSNLGFDVAIALALALAFAVGRRFVLDMIEQPRPSLQAGRLTPRIRNPWLDRSRESGVAGPRY